MSNFSPMMKRVRGEKNRSGLKIPKKGRIRIIIIVLTIGIIAWFKFAGSAVFTDSSKNGNIKEVKKIKKVKKVNKKVPKEKETNKSTIQIEKKVEREFVYPEIGGLLKDKNASFDLTEDTLIKGKRKIILYYSIDTTLQKLGNTLMKRYKPLYGAIVAMNPVNGRILSLVSWEHDSVQSLGGQLYCRSVFPAASIYKTITAAAAVELAGLTSESMVKHTGRNHTLYKYQLQPELKIYKDVTLEEAYASSINPVFARIGLYILNGNEIVDFGKRFGFNDEIPFELSVEKSLVQSPDSNFTIAELASGFNQKTTLSPLHGALIASAISEKGKMPYPHVTDSIFSDSIVYRVDSKQWKTVMSGKAADEIKGLMKCVCSYGTARKSFRTIKRTASFDNIDYGGKTGSVDKDSTGRVDWFVGFACHPEDMRQRIAVGIVTVHGAYWTVHSSYIAAEMFRVYIRGIQIADESAKEVVVN